MHGPLLAAFGSVERALAIEGLRIAAPRAARIRELVPQVGDWPAFLGALHANATLPTFAATCATAGVAVALPASAARVLRDALVGNELQNRVLLDEIDVVATTLRRAGIEGIVLKGGALVATEPALLRARHVDDVDFLVAPQDAARAQAVLRDAGFEPKDVPLLVGRRGWDGVLRDQKPPDWHHQLWPLLSPRGVMVELHRALGSHGSDGVDDDARAYLQLRARARSMPSPGGHFLVPSRDDLADQLCVHVVLHHGLVEHRYWPRHLVDTEVVGLRHGGARDFEARVARAITRAIARGALSDDATAVERRAAEPLVFPTAAGVRVLGAVDLGRKVQRVAAAGPAAMLRALFPTRSFMDAVSATRGHGLTPSAPLPARYAHRLYRIARDRLAS